jgi:hypothetical protein
VAANRQARPGDLGGASRAAWRGWRGRSPRQACSKLKEMRSVKNASPSPNSDQPCLLTDAVGITSIWWIVI